MSKYTKSITIPFRVFPVHLDLTFRIYSSSSTNFNLKSLMNLIAAFFRIRLFTEQTPTLALTSFYISNSSSWTLNKGVGYYRKQLALIRKPKAKYSPRNMQLGEISFLISQENLSAEKQAD